MKIFRVLIVITVVCILGCGSAASDSSSEKGDDQADAAPSSAMLQDDSSPESKGADKKSDEIKKDTITWYDYEEAVSRGKNENKKIFLNFYADWCHYCKVMESKTFRDRNVVGYINENFIPVRINTDKNQQLAIKYNVRGLPATWFLTKDGENIGSQPGFIPPDLMLPLLKYISSDSYKSMNFKKFQDSM